MKIINMGSLNLDNVYQVRNIVRPGETISSTGMEVHCGGKGLNQSIALAKAGMEVYHAGIVGTADGDMLIKALEDAHVNTSLIRKIEGKSGHCIIQVDENGQNCIVLHGGANHAFTEEYIGQVLDQLSEGDYLLLQNEINMPERILKEAARRHLSVIMNPSPMDDTLRSLDLSTVSMFILNEVEGEDLTGEKDPDAILQKMKERYPDTEVVLTLGSSGSVYSGASGVFRQGIFPVKTVDTTAAGDTFTGYFISEYMSSKDAQKALRIAAKASSIAVTRAGAAPSIPWKEEVEKALLQ